MKIVEHPSNLHQSFITPQPPKNSFLYSHHNTMIRPFIGEAKPDMAANLYDSREISFARMESGRAGRDVKDD